MAHREYNSTGIRNFDASEVIPRHRLVKLDAAGTISLADVAADAIGVSINDAFAIGDNIGVKLLTAAGTVALEAAGALTAGDVVWGRNDGKVDDTNADSAIVIGRALEDAGADGDIIEVLIDKNAA